MFVSEPSRGVRFRRLLEMALPFVVALLCVVLTMVPFGFWPGVVVAPSFALMAVYYWSLYRPDLMPPIAIFLVGLYQDLLSGGPLGLWALIYLMVYGIIVSQRLFFIGKAFFAIWFGLGVVVALTSMIMWGICSLYYGTVLSPLPIIGQAILTFAIYPVFGRAFGFVQRRLLSAS